MGSQITTLLRRHGWLLNLLYIALGAYSVAGGINAVLARHIREVPSLEDVPLGQTAVGIPAEGSRRPLSAIAERNLLGLKRENLSPENAGANASPSQVSGREFKESELQACSLSATLRATLVAEDAPQWSMAILVNNASRESQAYSILDGHNQIADDAVLVAIRSREIVVRRRDHFERCLGEGENGQVAPAVAAYDDGPPPVDSAGVVRVSETEYRVERAEVDRVLANLNEVATQARIVPSFKNGKPNGFKLFSIRPGSIFDKIGLKNGDVIVKINGFEMNSPDRALEVYTKLRDATSLVIEILRRSQGMTLNYLIR